MLKFVDLNLQLTQGFMKGEAAKAQQLIFTCRQNNQWFSIWRAILKVIFLCEKKTVLAVSVLPVATLQLFGQPNNK